jgi:hypothetical protein
MSITLGESSINLRNANLISSGRLLFGNLSFLLSGEFDGGSSSFLLLQVVSVGHANFFFRFFLNRLGDFGLFDNGFGFTLDLGRGFSLNLLAFLAPVAFTGSLFAISTSSTTSSILSVVTFVFSRSAFTGEVSR